MYKHLTSEERHYIAIGIKQGMSKKELTVKQKKGSMNVNEYTK
jgi:hypothetical protein